MVVRQARGKDLLKPPVPCTLGQTTTAAEELPRTPPPQKNNKQSKPKNKPQKSTKTLKNKQSVQNPPTLLPHPHVVQKILKTTQIV